MKFMKRPMILLVPYPALGHVTPLLQLGSCFLSRGFMPVLITPEFIHRQIAPSVDATIGVLCLSVPDGMEGGAPVDFFAIEMSMETAMPLYLERLVRKLDEEDGGVACMVVDLLASWAIKVANQCGVPAAGFWPAMLSTYDLISAIPELIRTGLISETGVPEESRKICFLPRQPELSTEDLPWLIGTFAAIRARFKFWTRTLARTKTLPWVLVNSFPEECSDGKLQNQLNHSPGDSTPHVLQIGPLCKQATVKTPSLWEEDFNCLRWLEQQKPDTVIYISFGSWVSPIEERKVRDLALALEASRRPFIWVLRPNWHEGLPVGYLERVSKQGKVVSWAPQMELLQHKAVGFYLTHCGWNSTLEAIKCQKRLLCFPVAGDQFVNCAYIVQVWQIGVRIHGFGVSDLEEALRKVMEDSEINTRLSKLNERIMGEEASLRVAANITVFIDNLKKHMVN